MSDENEHTSEETEAEMNAGNHTSEQSKSDTSMLNNGMDQPMLEDEEMPTYVSISSPSRREDPNVNDTKQQDRIPLEEEHSRSPYPSDDQGGGSIYVLSSGEESNHPYNDEEDEYADSEEMDEMDPENEHENIMVEEEDEEDEEEDEDENPLKLPNDDDEDIDTEYDQEYFDRASDDFILSNRMKQHHKERSLSLQDLSFSKNNVHTPYNKKRHSLNVFRQNYLGLQQNAVVYPVTQTQLISIKQKQLMQPKYQHVESKVKQYIRDIKEQNRKSIERRIKEQEYVINKYDEENENNDTNQLKPTVTNKIIKDYAEKAIKDLQSEENNEDVNPVYNTTQIVENGESKKTDVKASESHYKHIRRDTENAYNDTKSEKRSQNCDDRLGKRNGSVGINAHLIECQNTSDSNAKFGNMDQPSLVNGHEQTPTLFNLRSLSYEEYMHGTTNNEQGGGLTDQRHRNQEKTNDSETYNETEMMNAQEIENSNTSCSLKIESVKSIRVTQEEPENVNFAQINTTDKMNAENMEVMQLKTQLSEKDAQFHNLKNVYQKTLAENMKMKQELDALKKSLAKYESENKSREMKVASVQTESIIESTSSQESTTSKEETNKVHTSSVASTISSINHWVDSDYNPAISIKPPDLTSILNSDDSIVLTNGTPRKTVHPLSRTFITSSRILQTLSNITQGKAKIEKPVVKSSKKRLNENSPDQLLNLEHSSSIQASSSKKRKAADTLDASTFAQPFKMPYTSAESEKKNHSDTANIDFKFPEEHTSSKLEQQPNSSVNKSVDGSTSMEIKTEETNEQEDSVKCFIYREDENSRNRSFLIQAEEPTKDRLSNQKNRIQECGPYLLGNLEVRMSEINGTISVWGKEINQEPSSDNEDDMEISIESTEKTTCNCWQKTQTRFNGSPLMCSTNKKQKIPLRLNSSNVSQCWHSSSLNTIKPPFLIDSVSDKKHIGNTSSSSTCVPPCESYDFTKQRKEWPLCKSISSSEEKLHSCCIHHTEFIEKEYNCDSCREKQRYDDSFNHNRDKFHKKGIRRSSYKSTTSDSHNHLHESITNAATKINEVTCKYNSCRRSLQNTANSPHSIKCCNNVKNLSLTCKSFVDNIHNHDSSDKQTSNHSLSNDSEENPLISFKQSNETPEARQRRLSGKRVRGILMDLLRGCGDCRSNVSKNDLRQKETLYTANGPPQIKISPSPMPEPACSSSAQCNDKCCHAYARRIESQLEEFRMEMERVRSRSDTILDMLNNMLHSVDTN